MASPFKVFRKNQKFALAILTILAMFGFVVLPTVVQMMGDGGNRATARRQVVTTTRYGNIDAAKLSELARDRQAVLGFLNRVDSQVRIKQQNFQAPTVAGAFQRRLSPEDRGIVETWLLANRAEELGVVVNDDAVNLFVKQITENALSQEEFGGLLKNIGLPETQLFRLLKYELMAMRLQDLFYTSLLPTTPGERWDYYQRLRRNMSVELAEVPVERFLNSVKDPDEATLEQFFNKYKDQEDIPESPEPGFKKPKQIAIEYFKVDYDHLFEPGELEKYYEEHQEEFKRESLPAVEQPSSPPDLKRQSAGIRRFEPATAAGRAGQLADVRRESARTERSGDSESRRRNPGTGPGRR
jgi:hypothetical protein